MRKYLEVSQTLPIFDSTKTNYMKFFLILLFNFQVNQSVTCIKYRYEDNKLVSVETVGHKCSVSKDELKTFIKETTPAFGQDMYIYKTGEVCKHKH